MWQHLGLQHHAPFSINYVDCVHIVWYNDVHYWLVCWLPFLAFSHILGIIIPTDFHIFQRGGPTTNQIILSTEKLSSCNRFTKHMTHKFGSPCGNVALGFLGSYNGSVQPRCPRLVSWWKGIRVTRKQSFHTKMEMTCVIKDNAKIYR